jgi:hypothetical protein
MLHLPTLAAGLFSGFLRSRSPARPSHTIKLLRKKQLDNIIFNHFIPQISKFRLVC